MDRVTFQTYDLPYRLQRFAHYMYRTCNFNFLTGSRSSIPLRIENFAPKYKYMLYKYYYDDDDAQSSFRQNSKSITYLKDVSRILLTLLSVLGYNSSTNIEF